MLLICSPRQMGAYWQIPRVHLGVRGVSPNFRPAKISVVSCTVKLLCVSLLFITGSNNNRTQRVRLTFASSGTSVTSHVSVKALLFSFRVLPEFVADVPMQTTLAHWSDSWQSLCKRRGLLHSGQSAAARTRSDCSEGSQVCPAAEVEPLWATV